MVVVEAPDAMRPGWFKPIGLLEVTHDSDVSAISIDRMNTGTG